MKKYLSLLMVAILLTALFAPMTSADSTFESDDLSGHWAEGAMRPWISKGLLSGYDTLTFKPDAEITRAEFCALLDNLVQLPESQITFEIETDNSLDEETLVAFVLETNGTRSTAPTIIKVSEDIQGNFDIWPPMINIIYFNEARDKLYLLTWDEMQVARGIDNKTLVDSFELKFNDTAIATSSVVVQLEFMGYSALIVGAEFPEDASPEDITLTYTGDTITDFAVTPNAMEAFDTTNSRYEIYDYKPEISEVMYTDDLKYVSINLAPPIEISYDDPNHENALYYAASYADISEANRLDSYSSGSSWITMDQTYKLNVENPPTRQNGYSVYAIIKCKDIDGKDITLTSENAKSIIVEMPEIKSATYDAYDQILSIGFDGLLDDDSSFGYYFDLKIVQDGVETIQTLVGSYSNIIPSLQNLQSEIVFRQYSADRNYFYGEITGADSGAELFIRYNPKGNSYIEDYAGRSITQGSDWIPVEYGSFRK